MKKLLIKLARLPFVTWLARSLLGNITGSVLAWVIIYYPIMAALIYSEGDLTFSWALYMLGLSVLGGAIVGIVGWFGATRPFIKWVERKRKVSDDKP